MLLLLLPHQVQAQKGCFNALFRLFHCFHSACCLSFVFFYLHNSTHKRWQAGRQETSSSQRRKSNNKQCMGWSMKIIFYNTTKRRQGIGPRVASYPQHLFISFASLMLACCVSACVPFLCMAHTSEDRKSE